MRLEPSTPVEGDDPWRTELSLRDDREPAASRAARDEHIPTGHTGKGPTDQQEGPH